jgi:hypothetical protein
MTPQEITTGLLGRGPTTVRDVAGELLKKGWHPTAVLDQARICLTYLVEHRRAEIVRVGNVDVYRLTASAPMEKRNEEP